MLIGEMSHDMLSSVTVEIATFFRGLRKHLPLLSWTLCNSSWWYCSAVPELRSSPNIQMSRKRAHSSSSKCSKTRQPPTMMTPTAFAQSKRVAETGTALTGGRIIMASYPSPGSQHPHCNHGSALAKSCLYLALALAELSLKSTCGHGYPSFSNSRFPNRSLGINTAFPFTPANSGTHFLMKSPFGSCFSA